MVFLCREDANNGSCKVLVLCLVQKKLRTVIPPPSHLGRRLLQPMAVRDNVSYVHWIRNRQGQEKSGNRSCPSCVYIVSKRKVSGVIFFTVIYDKKKVIYRDPCTGVPVNNSILTGTLSNVRRCWLAMPLGAGVLSWVLACGTIENKHD